MNILFQTWEVSLMSDKIQKMPSQLKKLLELTIRAEKIEEAAEENEGFDEYLYDALRVTRSEIRMYGKDVDFYDIDGNDLREKEKGKGSFVFPWSFNKK